MPLADFTDIYPTLCELAGVALSPRHRPDGRSFAPYLLGRPGAVPPRTWILNEYHTTRVVRGTRFKLYSDGRLFDAQGDPAETMDLAGSADPAVAASRQRLQAVLDAVAPGYAAAVSTAQPVGLQDSQRHVMREAAAVRHRSFTGRA